MGRKPNATTTTTDAAAANPQVGMTAQFQERFQRLFETRFYKDQTEADLWETILHQGIKTIEKRREETKESQIKKAQETLRKLGAA